MRSPVKACAVVLSLAVLTFGAACGSGATPSHALPAGKHSSSARRAATFPEAGVILRATIVARAEPNRHARAIAVLRQFRPDNRPTIVFAVASTRDATGTAWYRIHLPGRSNTRRGWIAAAAAQLHPVRARIVIDRGSRTLKLYDEGRLRFRTTVAVGRPGMETPTGDFYVRAGFHATEPALGAYAFETSAYSRLSEWPGGGIVGIHGTPQPQLLGTAASHGCVRVSNAAALTLERLVPVGTAISIVD
jgi:lipoprotein-anchoring transpeptidase ErfK/SrfK